jgi:hypothetical protein
MFARIQQITDYIAALYQEAITPPQWKKSKEVLDYSQAARVMLLKRHGQRLIKRNTAIGCNLVIIITGTLRMIDPSIWYIWAAIALISLVIDVIMIRMLAQRKIANGISGYEVYQLRKQIAHRQICSLKKARWYISEHTCLYRHYCISETQFIVWQFTGIHLSDRQTIAIVQQLRYQHRLGPIAAYNLPVYEEE